MTQIDVVTQELQDQRRRLDEALAAIESAKAEAFAQSEYFKQQQEAERLLAEQRKAEFDKFHSQIVASAARQADTLRQESAAWHQSFEEWSQEGKELAEEQREIIARARAISDNILNSVYQNGFLSQFKDEYEAANYVESTLTQAIGATPIMGVLVVPQIKFVTVPSGQVVGTVRSVMRQNAEKARIARDTSAPRLVNF